MGSSSSTNPNVFLDAGRMIMSLLDSIGVALLGAIYKIFYMVANATIIKGEVIKVFYSRIQLILGIIMIFKLAMTILNIIINPDIIKDQKQGTGKVVTRIVVALFMLTLVIPINIPNAKTNSLNAYINDHGILFGFLYKTQDTILSENIIAKLVLGVPSDSSTSLSVNNLDDVGNTMASTVLKVFVRINVKDEDEPICDNENKGDPCPNVVCPDEVNASHYAEDNVDPQIILDHINEDCGSGSDHRYAFVYTPFLGAVFMIIMALIIAGFTVDIAVRAIKLAVLRLIAPVPIISYINPPKQGGGAFDNWTKSLISTYVDLFIRLAIVYFGLFLIRSLLDTGPDVFGGDAASNAPVFYVGMAFIFVILGILVFMRQAPQFIRDVLGIKGKPMGNVGLSSMMAGTASLIGGAGLVGAGAAAMGTFRAASDAASQGKPMPSGWGAGRDLAAQLRTGDPKAKGGIINNLQDRLSRGANIRMARRYGVTAAGLDVAKKNMYAAQDQAAKSKDLYDRFLKGKATNEEMAEIAANKGIDYNARTGTFGSTEAREQMRKALYDYQSSDAKKAAKAKSLYDEGAEYAKSHRINPSFEEEHRPSLFGERGNDIINRPDMYNARGRGRTAHQTIGDRMFGSYTDWDDPSSGRVENRWNPNINREVSNDTYHDDPFGPTGAGEPGPRGGPGGRPGPRP